MCPIASGLRDRAISLYRSLDLVPSVVLHCRRTAPLYEACDSVWRVRWPLRLLTVDTIGVLCKMPHICTIAAYADMLYVYGICDTKRRHSNLPQQISTTSPVKVNLVSQIFSEYVLLQSCRWTVNSVTNHPVCPERNDSSLISGKSVAARNQNSIFHINFRLCSAPWNKSRLSCMNPVTVRPRATFSAHVACCLSSPHETLNDLMLCPIIIITVNAFTMHAMTQSFLKCGKHTRKKKARTTVTNQNRKHKEIKNSSISGECLLPFGLESTVFQFAIQKFKA